MVPLVSILIPAYNAQRWIADTIRSAVAQTWPRKEIILVDDGSTDQTLEIAQRFGSPELCVLTQRNEGASAARNKAFAASQGDFIQWLDADDLLAPDKLEKQMKTVEQCNDKRILFSSTWGSFMYRPSRAEFRPTALWRDLSPTEWLLRAFSQNLFMADSNWLVSQELSEAAGPWDTRLSLDDDGEYFCRVLLASSGVRFVPDAMTLIRTAVSSSLSNVDLSDKKLESQCLSIELQISYLRSREDSDRVREACLKFLQTWLIYFFHERPDLVSRLQRLASELGGELQSPVPSQKYFWIRRFFGERIATRSQFFLPQLKWGMIRLWDQTMFRLESGVSGRQRD